jgi:phosphoenolpyruvate carboxykinase (ATP)
MIKAILSGAMTNAPMVPDPIFGIQVPVSCPGVPADILSPRKTWKDPAAYDEKARELAAMFATNFRESASGAPVEVRDAGPKLDTGAGPLAARSATVREPVAV